MRIAIIAAALGLAVVAAPIEQLSDTVTWESLAKDFGDPEALTRLPEPWFETRQASSYDRAAVNPSTNWFANADAGQFLRNEEVSGRIEHVMADLVGPGVVERVWSANPNGVVRFYFDGETTPRLEANLADLLNGRFEPFGDPYAYEASRGTNLYFPIPFAKSLKVTVDNSNDDAARSLYYHIGYRQYFPGTKVPTFTMEGARRIAAQAKDHARLWSQEPATHNRSKSSSLAPKGAGILFSEKGGPGQIARFRVRVKGRPERRSNWDDPGAIHNLLRFSRLVVDTDGRRCIDVPLGDFFGSAPGLNPYKTSPMSVGADGWMTCALPMPYKERIEVKVENGGKAPLEIEAQAVVSPYEWSPRSLYLKSQWLAYEGSTRPMRDLEFLHTGGPGVFVGSMVAILNPHPGGWWGEGDEKIYLDGESFPSTFGTGTEDYFGYAWSNDQKFQRPFHAQTRVDGPGLLGNSSIVRWHIIDRMPFRSAFKFDMELWSWETNDVVYTRTVWWYGLPSGSGPARVDESLLKPRWAEPAPPVKGAIEGESLRVVSKTGEGALEAQEGFATLSGGKQLWWRNGQPGDQLVLELNVKKAGRYEVKANLCHNTDYGRHRIRLGSIDRVMDFYNAGLKWETVSLGVTDLQAGPNRIVVTIDGQNEKATGAYMFGLDYLLLEPK